MQCDKCIHREVCSKKPEYAKLYKKVGEIHGFENIGDKSFISTFNISVICNHFYDAGILVPTKSNDSWVANRSNCPPPEMRYRG